MYKFDFNILEPAEFENLVADLITTRESILQKTSFTVITQDAGPDGGVDFSLDNGGIIGQAKRYKDKNNLMQNLKRESEKAKSLNPKRYILIVSLPLTFQNRQEIIELFNPFIRSESDLLDQIDLSRLLDKHREILLRHNKLWISSTIILQQVIEETVRKAFSDVSQRHAVSELKEIATVKDYFVSTDFFPRGIDVLRKKSFLIITGDPGIGKTTLARAICHFYMEHKGYKELHYHHGINPPLTIPDNPVKSIFFLDDFLGTTIYDKARIENISFFQSFVDKIYDDGHLLIVTTREYIYQQEKKVNPRFRQMDDYKYIIAHTGYSREEKLQILLNNVTKAQLPYTAVNSLKQYAEAIITAPNYRPKLIAEFLRKDCQYFGDAFDWGYRLLTYMESPYEYWELTFLDLSSGAQLFLLCLFISNEPSLHTFLYQTFKSVSRYRQISSKGYEADTFHEAIRELNNTFIYIDKNTDTNELAYSFASTFIKDFLLQYLRNQDYHIEYLIRGAIAYNQLFFAFTNKKEDYIKVESYEVQFCGQKILLNKELQEVLLDKVIKDFNKLVEMRVELVRWDQDDVVVKKKNKEDNRVHWLLLFIENFNLEQYSKARKFVLGQIKKIAVWEDDRIYLNEAEISSLPVLIVLIRKHIKIDPYQLITSYYKLISRTEHFLKFYTLRKSYRIAFDKFVANEKEDLTEFLNDTIENDITEYAMLAQHYRDMFAYYALNKLFDETIIDVFDYYGLALSNTQWNSWLDHSRLSRRKLAKKQENVKEYDFKTSRRKKKIQSYADAGIDHVLPKSNTVLTKNQIDELVISNYPEQAEQVLLMMKKKSYLYQLVRFSSQLKPIINFCITSSFQISKNKPHFVLQLFRFLIKPLMVKTDPKLSEKDFIAMAGFSSYTASRQLDFFKEKQYNEFAREFDLDQQIFKKFANSPLLLMDNGWYSYVIPEIGFLFRSLYLKSLRNKNELYNTEYVTLDNTNFDELWDYLGLIDKVDFISHFLLPKMNKFLQYVKGNDPKQFLQRYFRYFGMRIGYREKDKVKYRIDANSNFTTLHLFDYLFIRLSEKIFKNFPFESGYLKNEINDQHCANLLEYLEKEWSGSQKKSVALSAIKDDKFWDLLIKTELAELIRDEVIEFEKEVQRLALKIGIKTKDSVISDQTTE